MLGMSTAKYLSSAGIRVLCLGRKPLSSMEIRENFGVNSSYVRLSMERICSLKEKLEQIGWSTSGKCVFYHFAWKGSKSLADGSFEDQLNNATHAANAVKAAREIGCFKFVNVGSLEETYVERYLGKENHLYNFNQANYAISKLASRNICKMVAYLEKINYVHTRLSVPLIPDLSKGMYVSSTLRKIFQGEPYEKPKNKQLFDIVLTDDVAKAYHLIGKSGKNKADYFIGTSKPDTLRGYFKRFEHSIKGFEEKEIILDAETKRIFDSNRLKLDTGFSPRSSFLDIIKNLQTA